MLLFSKLDLSLFHSLIIPSSVIGQNFDGGSGLDVVYNVMMTSLLHRFGFEMNREER